MTASATKTIERDSASPEETEALGARLGAAARGRELLGLVGELGAGKTCLVRGLAAGLGVDPDEVASPTFVMVAEYRGGRLPLQHVDLYRLEGPRLEATDEDRLLLRETLQGDGVAAVEWFDRLGSADGEEMLLVTLRYGDGDRRHLRFDARGRRHVRWLTDALGA
jgi:tRNA threonylcarbamoyladenosine biosynthesis protein TsaE